MKVFGNQAYRVVLGVDGLKHYVEQFYDHLVKRAFPNRNRVHCMSAARVGRHYYDDQGPTCLECIVRVEHLERLHHELMESYANAGLPALR